MRDKEALFSLVVFAIVAFLCAGAYYLHTGQLGVLFAMFGIGICTAALFHRALQEYFSAHKASMRERDEQSCRILQELCERIQQSQGVQEDGNRHVAAELHDVRERIDVLTQCFRESLSALREGSTERNALLTEIRGLTDKVDGLSAVHEKAITGITQNEQQLAQIGQELASLKPIQVQAEAIRSELRAGNQQMAALLADILPNLSSALEERMSEMQQLVSLALGKLEENQRDAIIPLRTLAALQKSSVELLEALAASQQKVAEQLGELSESAEGIWDACDLQSKAVETGNLHLENIVGAQVKTVDFACAMDDFRKQLKTYAKSIEDAMDDVCQPVTDLGEHLSNSLQSVVQEIERQNVAQQTVMEQYKSMTAKDMQMLERLVKAMK